MGVCCLRDYFVYPIKYFIGFGQNLGLILIIGFLIDIALAYGKPLLTSSFSPCLLFIVM